MKPAPQIGLAPAGAPAEGPLVWLRVSAERAPEDQPTGAVIHLLAQLRRAGYRVAVSNGGKARLTISTRGVSDCAEPAAGRPAARAALAQVAPDLLLLFGEDLPRDLAGEALAHSIPVVMADARFVAPAWSLAARLSPQRRLVERMAHILVTDRGSIEAVQMMGCPPSRVELGGPVTEPREPLYCVRAEWDSLAEMTRGRQIWLASNLSAAELEPVLTAHLATLRQSHRALLIIALAEPKEAPAIAARLADAGLIVGERADEDDLTEETQVFLVDDPAEMGLWYRLAPVSFMGGTLVEDAPAPRHPFEPASLGSAIVHGPRTEEFGPEWRQLDLAGAARMVRDAPALAQAVVDLMQPARAARLAANAWTVCTGGAGAAARIVAVVKQTLAAQP